MRRTEIDAWWCHQEWQKLRSFDKTFPSVLGWKVTGAIGQKVCHQGRQKLRSFNKPSPSVCWGSATQSGQNSLLWWQKLRSFDKTTPSVSGWKALGCVLQSSGKHWTHALNNASIRFSEFFIGAGPGLGAARSFKIPDFRAQQGWWKP